MPRKSSITSTKKTKSILETNIHNTGGKIVSKINLPKEIFAVNKSAQIMAQAVKVYLANQRSGTASTKSRGDITGSTRKIYRQKGTGRARHGDIKAPIFVGGGIAHGPHPQDYSLTFPKKMKKQALFAALTDKNTEQKIIIMRGLDKFSIKTKKLYQILINVNLSEKEHKSNKVLLVSDKYDKNLYLSGRNIENVTVRAAQLLNPYDILAHSHLLMMEEAVEALRELYFKKKITISVKTPDIKKTAIKSKKGPVKTIRKSSAKKI